MSTALDEHIQTLDSAIQKNEQELKALRVKRNTLNKANEVLQSNYMSGEVE